MSRYLQHHTHRHPLKQIDDIERVYTTGVHIYCSLCELMIDRNQTCYDCSSSCTYSLHIVCAELPQYVDHGLHPHHGRLMLECAVPKIIVRCQSHDHSLFFVEKAFYEGVCNGCQKSYTQWSSECFVPKEVKRTQSFLFRCVECDFNLHFLCGPLPSIVKFDYHIHSLTLVDHYITKDDHNDEFYCDICEEERDPYIRIYCCKDCDFAAHIHCLLIECGWTESIDDTNDVLHTTLGEFLTDTLTDQDKALLSDPFTFGYSSDVKTYVDQMYKSCTQANYLLFDNQFRSSIEKIYQINHFPSFTSNDYQNFFSELLLYRPKEGLKLDEKYLRQKVVDIKGYKVPLTLAHILKTLLHQYTESDLFGESVWNWTPGIKSVFATTFCMVCDQMCRTNINDVTKHLLQSWFFYLNAIAGNRFTNMMFLMKFVQKIMNHFFCFEAIRYEKDIKEKLQGRITDLEAELKKCKEKLDMFNTHMAQTMERIKDPINDALSLEDKTVDQIISFDELLHCVEFALISQFI
ncbi:hypothetical protein G4B88_026925 [Cannabis sativa]|uniref:DC1 domain-containing protein n=1 Tax=Cannabis sativa TaxID=3483 RepID=A0A7J6EGU1_CANSA|nr:hypothetical protein G4B88_026925 [Cannabis sativa]